jgi:hypothetical protein
MDFIELYVEILLWHILRKIPDFTTGHCPLPAFFFSAFIHICIGNEISLCCMYANDQYEATRGLLLGKFLLRA